MGVLVADDRHVRRPVGAGAVEGAGDRLEQVLVRDAGDAVLQRDLVGVVAALVRRRTAVERAGLDVADLGVVLPRRVRVAAQVVELQVVVLLGEPEVVGEVVHPVVRHEQVRGRRVDVVARRVQLGRVALGVVPRVGERVGVLTGRRHRRLGRAAGGERAQPGLVGAGVVADGGERGGAGLDQVVPGPGGLHVLERPAGRGAARRAGVPAADDGVAAAWSTATSRGWGWR